MKLRPKTAVYPTDKWIFKEVLKRLPRGSNLLHALQLPPDSYHLARYTGNGSGIDRSRLDFGRDYWFNWPMKMFYFQFKATPSKSNPQYKNVKSVYAAIWVSGSDLETARISAMAYLVEFHWDYVSTEQNGVEAKIEDCLSPLALSRFRIAQECGISAVFAGTAVSSVGGTASFN